MALATVSAPFAAAATAHKRIVGGQVAKLGEFPFVVSLESQGRQYCGGALLDSTTVLTAAHCLLKNVTVRAGSIDRGKGGVAVGIASSHKHLLYYWIRNSKNDTFPVFDIGVAKLAEPIQTSDAIQFATLPTRDSRPETGSSMTAVGWGWNKAGKDSDQLLKVDLPVSSFEKCPVEEGSEAAEDTDIVCAGGGGIGIWRGDSGSPLIDPVSRQVVGVASRGAGQGKPQIFTNVGSYIDYIMLNVREKSKGQSTVNTTDDDQTPPSTGEDNSARIRQDFAHIRDLWILKHYLSIKAEVKRDLEAKLQAAEDDLVANVGQPDFATRVERHFAGFTNLDSVKAAMDNDATL
ncbi:hypothetical protein V2A60_005812 [Cordyceps javanica]